jgi:hypothetical protein
MGVESSDGLLFREVNDVDWKAHKEGMHRAAGLDPEPRAIREELHAQEPPKTRPGIVRHISRAEGTGRRAEAHLFQSSSCNVIVLAFRLN